MIVRRAREGDVPGILEVHAASVQELGSRDYTRDVIEAWSRPRPPEDYRASIAANPFYVAERASAVIGFAELEASRKLVRSVYVAPSHARQGSVSTSFDWSRP